jgi:potassium-dependent mechanosensitive channel
MSRLLAFFTLSMVLSAAAQGVVIGVNVAQIDLAIENTSSSMESSDPDRETYLNTYRETRELLLSIKEQEGRLEKFVAAKASAQDEARQIRSTLQASLESPAPAQQGTVSLAELEQSIQLHKSELAVLQNRLAELNGRKEGEATRPSEIRGRLAKLGDARAELEANLKLLESTDKAGGMDEARLWLAQAQYASNRGEKAALEAELLSQPMRLELLTARLDSLTNDVSVLEANLLTMERQASDMRQGEAAKVLAEAETARADAKGKHELVQGLAQSNALFSATLGELSAAIEKFRDRELTAAAMADQFTRELATIERKLDILGMNETVGEILREQAVRLPKDKQAKRELRKIAELTGESSLRLMALQDERRELRDVQAYVETQLSSAEALESDSVREDLMALALNRRDLVDKALEVERTYSLALSDLDFAVHRLADSADDLADFISERLLWIQSRESFSWSFFSKLPSQLAEIFAPGRWAEVMQWLVNDLVARPPVLFLLLLVACLVYLTPQIKARLVATGRYVGSVREDAISETLKALLYTLILIIKWPLLIFALALPLQHHEADSGLAAALHFALLRASYYYLGLEFMRCILLPGGLVESHFRWPAQTVKKLNRRVVRFEQTFLVATFFAVLSLHLYPTDVGGSLGTLAVVIVLLSMAYFFFRMPHFVQGKMDQFLAEPKARIHRFWGSAVRALLAWTPLAMIVSVLFGYTYTAIELSILLIQTVLLFTGMLLLHELGMRWLRVTRRRLRIKVQEEIALAQDGSDEDTELSVEEEILENDPELLSDEGTRFLNSMLLLGSLVGIVLVWSNVFPALGILDSITLWQGAGTVGEDSSPVYITVADLIASLAIAILGWVVILRMPNLFEILLRQKMEVAPASAYAVATVTKYILITVVMATVLSKLGGSWTQIQWAVAALSLGIGFGLQEIVANFFSGLIILFEQPIRVGDTITVGDTSGIVTRINMRATTIRDWDRRELLVPNKEFVTGRLLNWSLTDPITRLHIEVGVAYGTDMDKALDIVRQVALDHSSILDDPAPFVTFEEFGDSALMISLRCYLEELDKRLSIASAIRLEINRALQEADISIAFPQRDVHLAAAAPLDIRLVDPAS